MCHRFPKEFKCKPKKHLEIYDSLPEMFLKIDNYAKSKNFLQTYEILFLYA